jgi:hypothetical protein
MFSTGNRPMKSSHDKEAPTSFVLSLHQKQELSGVA